MKDEMAPRSNSDSLYPNNTIALAKGYPHHDRFNRLDSAAMMMMIVGHFNTC